MSIVSLRSRLSVPTLSQAPLKSSRGNHAKSPSQIPMAALNPTSSGDRFMPGVSLSRTLRFSASAKDDNELFREVSIRLPIDVWERFSKAALRSGYTKEVYGSEAAALGHFFTDVIAPWFKIGKPQKQILAPVEDVIAVRTNGKQRVQTKVKTLMGAENIFYQWLDMLKKTQHYAQIAMYDFDNIHVPGGANPEGAQSELPWYLQQKILYNIEKKARAGVKFQILLDCSVQYAYDNNGHPILPRDRNNRPMIEYLRELNEKIKRETGSTTDVIEVVPYPRELANIYHVKLLISDGKTALVSGMNMSNHSAANWDMGVAIQGPEVANLQAQTFYQDWVVAKFWEQHFTNRGWPHKQITGYLPQMLRNPADRRDLQAIQASLPPVSPVADPAIKILNTMPMEYNYFFDPAPGQTKSEYGREEIEDYFQQALKRPDLAGIEAEQFIACHKDIGRQLIDLAQNKHIPVRIVHSDSVTSQFPFTRWMVEQLREAELLRYYPEFKTTGERLHAKSTVFTYKKDGKESSEVVIGSANTSESGFKSNVKPGQSRGNRDMAVVIPSNTIAKAFQDQMNIDWNYSLKERPFGYGMAEAAQKAKREHQDGQPGPGGLTLEELVQISQFPFFLLDS